MHFSLLLLGVVFRAKLNALFFWRLLAARDVRFVRSIPLRGRDPMAKLLAVDPSGFVFVGQSTGVHRYGPNGQQQYAVFRTVTEPEGMAIDTSEKQGHIFVADNKMDCISVFGSNGLLVRSFGSRGSLDGQFFNPGAIALGPDDQLFGVDQGNQRVLVFQRDGTFIRKFGAYGAGDGQFGYCSLALFLCLSLM